MKSSSRFGCFAASEKILDPILGVTDLRNDQRIDFVGDGVCGIGETS